MNAFVTSMSAEWLKFRSALLPRLATIGMVAVPSVISPLTLSDRKGGSALAATNWEQYFDLTAGTVATGGLFGFGLVIVWMFGREFQDGTITALFGLPVSRETLALSKLTLFLIWATTSSLALAAVLVAVGGLLSFGPLDVSAWSSLLRFLAVCNLTALLTIPFAWVASRSRDYLAPIGAMLAVVILTSVLADAGLGAWIPHATPGLWASTDIGGVALVTGLQLLNVVIFSLIFAALLLRTWRHLEI